MATSAPSHPTVATCWLCSSPVALFDLTLSWLRITSRYDAPSGLAAITQLRSDVLAHLGFAVLWFVAYAVLRDGWRRAAVLVVSQLSVAGYLLFAVIAHSYYRKSGSLLDAGGLRMMVTDPEATRNIAASESSTTDVWVMTAAVAYPLLGPVLVYRLRYRGHSPRGRWLPGLAARSSSRMPTNRPSRLTALATTTGLLLVVAAAVPVTSGVAVARNQALGVAPELGSSLLESYAQTAGGVPKPAGRHQVGGGWPATQRCADHHGVGPLRGHLTGKSEP